jgi:hypothetical protein
MSIRRRVWTTRGVKRAAWIFDYCDQAGKRHLKTFATKKEADSWAIAALHEVQQGIHRQHQHHGERGACTLDRSLRG